MGCPSEDSLQGFIEGRLSPEEVEALSFHLDVCEHCRAVVGAALPVRDLGEGDRLGRYLLRRVIGAGAMGVVYEAYDPELKRRVALKLLRPELGPSLQARLVNEAQSLARLSHPHVVSVYDIGRANGQVFVVMDLVEGTSLREWLLGTSRSLEAILNVFIQAADGLAAAHGAGLVHRDFKPENVLIDKEGRARVGDFGLAFADAYPAGSAVAVAEGSPAYMAPEQRSGEQADARSDQFSFCVALAEATSPQANRARWLTRVIERGTAKEPNARFASMRSVKEALEQVHRRGGAKTWARVVLGVLVIAALALAGIAERRHQMRRACRAAASTIDREWPPPARSELRVAFTRASPALSTKAWERVSQALSQYQGEWRETYVGACEATRLRKEQPEQVLQETLGCLSDRAQLLQGVVGLFTRVDAPMLERVPAILQTLAPISTCVDARALAQEPPPPEPGALSRVQEVRGTIAEGAVAINAGRYQEGLSLADKGVAGARATGYLPILAEALLWAGTAHGRLGHAAEARASLEEAAAAAAASHAERIATRAWIQLMHFVGVDAHQPAEGFRYNEYAEAALNRMWDAAELDAERLSWLSAILADQKRFEEARRASRAQLAKVEAHLGQGHRLYPAALDGLAGVLSAEGRNQDALPIQQKACDALERDLGTPHPQVALCLNNLAALFANVGDHERAIELKRRALETFSVLPGHPSHMAMTHRNLARSFLELGHLREAKEEIDAAAALGKSSTDEISVLELRGELLRREGRVMDALLAHRQAVARTAAVSLPSRLRPLLEQGWSALAAGQAKEAREAAEQAVQVAQTVYGTTSFRLAEPLRLMAEVLLAARQPDRARPFAEQSLKLLGDVQIDPVSLAKAQFCLARALPGTREGARAAALVEAAEERGANDPELIAQIRRWSQGAPARASRSRASP
jgi:tetratricopeptide (TPR) repeat protein/tRNA A-37 threonylcarbamoyl transferase component Bud32